MQGVMILLLLLVNIMPLNCATDEISPNKIERMAVSGAEVIDSVAVGQEVWFKATASTPSPCWKFHHLETTREQNTINVVVYAEYDEGPCAQVTSSIEAAGSIVLNEPGVYTFKFWQAKGKTLDKKVVVE